MRVFLGGGREGRGIEEGGERGGRGVSFLGLIGGFEKGKMFFSLSLEFVRGSFLRCI